MSTYANPCLFQTWIETCPENISVERELSLSSVAFPVVENRCSTSVEVVQNEKTSPVTRVRVGKSCC